MKRTITFILCVIMLYSVVALAEDSATVTVDGVGEHVTVTLTMEDDRIKSVQATSDNPEADERGKESLALITSAIVEKNNFTVDTISGATCTSNAVIAGAIEAWLQIMTERMSQEEWMQESSHTEESASEALERLYALNRASIANMSIGDGPVYVIGHRSPDSDTVCSAIAYARLLTMMGYPAEAAITEPVNRETTYILNAAGVKAPQVLEDAAGQSIFLVDHSEYAQAAEGMEDAHIVGILDHHGVGSVTTGQQVVYEAKPIGATATIIWLDYMNYGLEIDKPTATLLLGAVLSDTANLTTSSVTETDRQAAADLAGLAEIADVKAFYLGLHSEALSYEGMSNEEILFSDYKEYSASGVKFGIDLISAIDEDHARAMAVRMKEALPQGLEKVDVDLLYADIGIREGDLKVDYIVPCEGKSKEYFEAAFPNYDEYDGTAYIFRNGGLGRKSRFVPGLTDYLNAHPHD